MCEECHKKTVEWVQQGGDYFYADKVERDFHAKHISEG